MQKNLKKLGAVCRLICALALAGTAFTPVMGASDKVLKLGITQEYDSLNPLLMQQVIAVYIYNAVGRRLTMMDPDWKIECSMCTHMSSLESGDAKRVTENGVEKILVKWEIKKEAVWGDGEPVTGHDFRLSWQIGLSPNVSTASRETIDKIEDIVVDAKNSKIFTVKYREARYDYYQGFIVPPLPSHIEGPIFAKTKDQQGAYEKQTMYTTNPTLVGLYSGPFVVEEVQLGSHIILKKNPKYWGTPAKLDRLIFKVIANTQALEASLISGEIDMASELGMTMDQALAFEKRLETENELGKRFQVLFREGLTYEHVDIDLENPILKDVRVRRALVVSLDRAKMTQALFKGRQKPALHLVHPNDPYYSDDVELNSFDIDKAKALLDDAGWKVGAGGYRFKDGQKLKLTVMTTAQNKTRELVQVWLQNEWKKVGIDLTIRNEPARVFFGETLRRRAYENLAMYAVSTLPDSPPRATLHSHEIPSERNGYAGGNRTAFANKEVDKLLDDVFVEFDFAKRKEIMKRVQQIYAIELPAIPLYLRSEVAVTPKKLKGFRLSGHSFMSTAAAENWDLE